MKCSFEGCINNIRSNGYCNAHNNQLHKGKKLAPLRKTDQRKLSIKQRIKNNVVKDPDTKCWNWQLAKGTDGYGVFCHNGKNFKAHRISYAEHVGPIAPNAVVHHKCANRQCINPKHLQMTSHQNNIAEMFERQDYIRRIKELEGRLAKYELQEISKADTDPGVS